MSENATHSHRPQLRMRRILNDRKVGFWPKTLKHLSRKKACNNNTTTLARCARAANATHSHRPAMRMRRIRK